jgi:hypothetical protein
MSDPVHNTTPNTIHEHATNVAKRCSSCLFQQMYVMADTRNDDAQ